MKYILIILIILLLAWLYKPVEDKPVIETTEEETIEINRIQLGGQTTETSPGEEFIMSN